MRILLLFLLLIFESPAQAQWLYPLPGHDITDLRCPATRKKPASPMRKPAPVQDYALAPPDEDELAQLALQSESHAAESIISLSIGHTENAFSVGIWGDSHTAANFFSEELIRQSGFDRELVLPSYIPATIGRAGVRLPIRKHCLTGIWSYQYAYPGKELEANFSASLVRLVNQTENAELWIDFRFTQNGPALSALDIDYTAALTSPHTRLAISLDNGPIQEVELDGDPDAVLKIRPEQPFHILKIRLVSGKVALEGFRPDYAIRPALVMDTLSIPGATVRGWSSLAPAYMQKRQGNKTYDLIILQYGTNEGNDRNLEPSDYAALLEQALQNLRTVFPQSACVLIGPTDRGILAKRPVKRKQKTRAAPTPPRQLLRYSLIHEQIGRIQQEVGQRYSCSFWSWQDNMGGPGAAYRWYRSTPRLMASDLIHLTVPGYQASARSFARAINWTTLLKDESTHP